MKRPNFRAASQALAAVAAHAPSLITGAVVGVAVVALAWPWAARSPGPRQETVRATAAQVADFGDAPASADARAVADWVARTRDGGGAPFLLIDKKLARLHVFDAAARLVATSPVLLGEALGDHSVPGIGQRPTALVRPEERTTPAGRFVGERGRNARGEDVVWVDYDAAVSIHRVIHANVGERRLERLASPSPDDNRISYGCVNVPTAFYDAQILPVFAQRTAMVYVLPDLGSVQQVFGLPPQRLASEGPAP
jgi:hypothetical protein